MPSNSKKLVGKPSAMEMTDMTISSSNGAATLGDEAINPAHANNVRFQDGDVSSASSGNGGVGKYSQSLTGSIRSSVKNLLTGESRAYQEFSAKRHKKKIAGEQFESFDYDAPDDRYKNYFIAAGAGGFGKKENEFSVEIGAERVRSDRKRALFRWLNLLIIGVVTGNVAYWMTFTVGFLNKIKWDRTWDLMHHGHTAQAFFYYIGWVFVCTLIAGLLAWWAPESAGSGIPLVKAYLNGNQISGLLKVKTFVAKMVGITVCVVSGMPAGREGPMVHAGSILAAGLARGYSDTIPCLPGMFNGFDNNRDRRDFVSMGAAAGVAAAFNAPIGGILFSLEEVSTTWSGELTWQTFVCAIVSAYTVNILMASGYGTFADEGLVLFGHDSGNAGEYKIWEVGLFIMIAVMGGFIGAFYVWVNEHLTMMRKKFWSGKNPALRIFEALIVVLTVLTIFFFLPMAFECKKLPAWYLEMTEGGDDAHRSLSESGGGFHSIVPMQYNCQDGYYNEMATLLLTPQETTILQLYSRGTADYLSGTTLAWFTGIFFACAVTSYGIAVPAGLFIPSMMIGAGTGRLVGVIVNIIAGSEAVDPGLYGLVGAAAVLGGITRMTISLTVIMVEITNDINYMLPIMLSVAISKAIGDYFTESLYDVHMEIACIPYLESDPPQVFDAITAESIMNKNVVSLTDAPSVAEAQSALETTHNAFPVHKDGTFVGMVTRSQVEELLSPKSDLSLKEVMDTSPFIVQPVTTLRRCLTLFRGMGLRHLPVCDVKDGKRQCVGMVTRKDFLDAPSSLNDALQVPKFEAGIKEFMKTMQEFAERDMNKDPKLRERIVKERRGSRMVGAL